VVGLLHCVTVRKSSSSSPDATNTGDALDDDPAPRWGIHWVQVLLGLLLVAGISALVVHARDAKGDSEREAELVARIDADAESVIITQNRSIVLYDAVDKWLDGSGGLEPSEQLRLELDSQLDTPNAAGSTPRDLVGAEYLSALDAFESTLDAEPPDPAAVSGAIEPFERRTVDLSRTYESLLDPERRAAVVGNTSNEERGMKLLLLVTLSGLLLGLVTTLRSRNAYRRSKARIDADRVELARASVLERGEADILAGIVRDDPIDALVVSVLDLAHRLTGGCLRFRRADGFEVDGLAAVVQRTDSRDCPVDHHHADGSPVSRPAGAWTVSGGGHVELGSLQLCPGGPDWTVGDRLDRVARRCADLIALVIDRALAAEQLHYRATHDVLTGMPNRDQALGVIAEALAARSGDDDPVAVIYCDLDRFKLVNDSFGHAGGDELLRSIARRLTASVDGVPVTIARLGGDEFLATCTGPDAAAVAVSTAEDMAASLKNRFVIDGHDVYVTASLGVAVADVETDDAEQLVREANVAVRAAKRDPEVRVVTFTPGLEAGLAELLSTDAAFRDALTDGGLVVHLQPVIDVEAGRAVGVEALVRWERDGRLVSPGEFLPIAEAAGLMGDLGQVVITQSLQALSAHRTDLQDVTLWLNIARVQFRDREFPARLHNELTRWNVPADALVLEVNEGDLIDVEEIADVIAELRRMGVRLAMDDFGTGYSSLVRLGELPVDIVKLDRAFVAALDGGGRRAHDVLRAAVDLVTAAELELVVEGVETTAELDAVRELGCTLIQGYLLRRPGPADEVLIELASAARSIDG
jgi:diguanylate cyclase (GGDEF)-like protein